VIGFVFGLTAFVVTKCYKLFLVVKGNKKAKADCRDSSHYEVFM
jgi:hypothetical protein